MGIKKLKLQNEYLNMTLGEIIAQLDISKTKKYSQFLVKMLNQKFNPENIDPLPFTEPIRTPSSYNMDKLDSILPNDTRKNLIIRGILCEMMFGESRAEMFINFCEMMERGIVNEKDISKYDSWEMIEYEFYNALNKKNMNEAKKNTLKIYEDDQYLLLKPMTHTSSCVYGYGTKWCTSMINDPGYFYEHSLGHLIYVINKKTNQRFGFYRKKTSCDFIFTRENNKVFTIYDAEDNEIDSFETKLPTELLEIISNDFKTEDPNYTKFDVEELKMMSRFVKLPSLEPKYSIRPVVTTSSINPSMNPYTTTNLNTSIGYQNNDDVFKIYPSRMDTLDDLP
jgi:hypothetical protein